VGAAAASLVPKIFSTADRTKSIRPMLCFFLVRLPTAAERRSRQAEALRERVDARVERRVVRQLASGVIRWTISGTAASGA
jgi:hypothetical protein